MSKPNGDTSGQKPVDFDHYFRSDLIALTRWLVFSGASPAEAQDAIQVAMMAAYTNWAVIESPRAYVRTIAMRHFLNERAKVRRDHDAWRRSSQDLAVIDYDFDTEGRLVLAVLTGLPRAQRHIMALTFDGYTPNEIAGILAQPAATVRSNLRHARRALSRQFNPGYDKAAGREANDGP